MKTPLRRLAKIVLFSLICSALLQWTTFSLFAKKAMVAQLGQHYESAVFDYNEFETVNFISPIEINSTDIKKCFPLFNGYNVNIFNCYSYKFEPLDSINYVYEFDYKKLSPFGKCLVYEVETAKEYMCNWESEYVWVLFGWIFINKEMKSIT